MTGDFVLCLNLFPDRLGMTLFRGLHASTTHMYESQPHPMSPPAEIITMAPGPTFQQFLETEIGQPWMVIRASTERPVIFAL